MNDFMDDFEKEQIWELDNILANDHPFTVLKNFIDNNYNGSVFCDNAIIHSAYRAMLFTPEKLKQYSKKHLLQIASLADMYVCNYIVLNRELPDEIRAFFWHQIHCCCNNHIIFFRKILMVNNRGRNHKPIYGKCNSEENRFLKNVRIERIAPMLHPLLHRALVEDSVSAFEMLRGMMMKKDVTKTMIYNALRFDAHKIIREIIKKYPKQFFKIRSSEEWLFFICNNFCNSAAVSAVQMIETQFPGTVKRIRDPWNNDLLWNTMFCDKSKNQKETLQYELIKLGCDPDHRNNLDLSFNLIMENTPEKWQIGLGDDE